MEKDEELHETMLNYNLANHEAQFEAKSELENHLCSNNCKESQRRIEELESKLKELAAMNHDHLSITLTELKSRKKHIQDLETELAIVKEANIDALREKEMMKTKSQREMEKFIELKEAYTDLKSSHSLLLEKEAEELKNAKTKLEILPNLERELLDKDSTINNLQAEMVRVHSLKISNIEQLQSEISQLKVELQAVEQEARKMEEIQSMETKSRVEITLLKSELQKGKLRIEAAEASEERAKIQKTELFLTVQQLALELKLAKKYNQEKFKSEEITVENESSVMNEEVKLRKELECANSKIWELKNRAEQAASRAAEKGKAEIEEKITKRREKREMRKGSTFASSSRNQNIINFEDNNNNNDDDNVQHMITYLPLGKVLNLKF